jgi:hypothetical protein
LENNAIDYYETPGGNWGFSVEAIWLKNEEQLPQARQLIGEYQIQLTKEAREKYNELKQQGQTETLIDKLKYEPVKFIAYIAAFLVVLYFSIKPFIDFAK